MIKIRYKEIYVITSFQDTVSSVSAYRFHQERPLIIYRGTLTHLTWQNVNGVAFTQLKNRKEKHPFHR